MIQFEQKWQKHYHISFQFGDFYLAIELLADHLPDDSYAPQH